MNDSDIVTRPKLSDGNVVVSMDTNVLFKLYKVSNNVREIYYSVFEELGRRDQLFVTDEVIREFWKNRAKVIAEWSDELKKYEGKLETSEDHLEESLKGLSDIEPSIRSGNSDASISEQFRASFKDLYQAVQEAFTELRSQMPAEPGATANDDAVVEKLRDLFDNRVGPPVDEARRDDLHKEAKDAVALDRSPGATDGSKISRSDLGDFLIWKQLLEFARTENNPDLKLVFVTAERKLDWWRTANPTQDKSVRRGAAKDSRKQTERGSVIGANQDLIEDFLEVCPRGMVYVISVEKMLERFPLELNIDVDESDLAAAIDETSRGAWLPVATKSQGIERFGEFNLDSRSLRIKKGTVMRKESVASLPPTAAKERDKLIRKGKVKLSSDGEVYEFTEGHEFSAASTAASVLCGASLGWRAWKTEDGLTLPEYVEKLENGNGTEEFSSLGDTES